MRQILEKLINRGNENFTKETDIKYNIVSNQLILIYIFGVLTLLLYVLAAVFYLYLNNDPKATEYTMYFTPAILLILGILIFSYIFKKTTGKNVLFLEVAYMSGMIYLLYMNFLVGKYIYAYLLLFTLIPLPFFALNKDKVRVIIVFEMVLFLSIIWVFWWNATHEPLFHFPEIIVTISNSILVILAISFLITTAFYLWNESHITEEKLFEEKRKTQEMYDKLNLLKTKQDGDYFLTALLTDSLNSNDSSSEKVVVETFLKSKKEFEFRNRKKELGGDLNIVDTILLSQKKYIVFLNADAMGKSIQGAGGALVLGAAFKSLVFRQKDSTSEDEKYPELWLKHTFDELQKIFETFNGSMLVSIILGLVDEETGFMYYINAEHPFMVLYRDGRAEFKDSGLQQRKLGVSSEFTEYVSIRCLQLQTNDTIIIGSDGRDDIVLFENGDMNMDENKFLEVVEESNGNIKEIYSNLQKRGEITDDLSFLKITYKGSNKTSSGIQGEYKKLVIQALREKNNKFYKEAIHLFEQALKTFSDNLFILKQLARINLKIQNFKEAFDYSNKVVEISPSETKFLYFMSIALNRLGQKERAIFYAERVYLREPSNIDNIVHLVKLYKSLNKTIQANNYCKHGLRLEYANEQLVKLKKMLEEESKTSISLKSD